MIPQGGIYYPITQGWLRTTQALAADLERQADPGHQPGRRPAGDRRRRGAGRCWTASGASTSTPWRSATSPTSTARSPGTRTAAVTATGPAAGGYDLSDYTKQFTQWSHVLPNLPLAGPATSGPAWMGGLGRFIAAEPRLKLVTYHRYPLRACITDPADPAYPSIPNLLADSASAGLAAPLAGYVQAGPPASPAVPGGRDELGVVRGGHGRQRHVRLGAMGAGHDVQLRRGRRRRGQRPHAPGRQLRAVHLLADGTGAWQAFVHPEYYGLLCSPRRSRRAPNCCR